MSQQKKRRRQRPGRFLNILILIIAILLVFEGNLLISIFKKESLQKQVTAQVAELLATETTATEATAPPAVTEQTEPATTVATEQSEVSLRSPAIVPTQNSPIDDSYFSDAVFIGDSRVEGFKNQSGITQGKFLTGVGMDVNNIFKTQFITLYQEQITVFQALYNTDYKKVYLMIGTNDLGTPDFNEFKESYRVLLAEVKKQAPNAIIYVMEIPYVEASKITDSETQKYVTNGNIDEANQKILELCEENSYYYINENEVLSNGNHSLKEGATSDGIHMYDTYCKLWLDYLKNHYISTSITN